MKFIITENQLNFLKEQGSMFATAGTDLPGYRKDDVRAQNTTTPKKVTNCSSDKLNATNWTQLYGELVKNNSIKNGDDIIIVWGPSQTAYFTKDGKSSTKTFKVSTGANGFGNGAHNKETPIGLLQVKGKIKARPYEVLVSKTPTGKILGPNKDSTRVDPKGNKHVAEVLTGILELDGMEPCNKNTFSRSIYFHGTNRERLLGAPHSNGCIRVANDTIQWLIGNVPSGTKVYVQP